MDLEDKIFTQYCTTLDKIVQTFRNRNENVPSYLESLQVPPDWDMNPHYKPDDPKTYYFKTIHSLNYSQVVDTNQSSITDHSYVSECSEPCVDKEVGIRS